MPFLWADLGVRNTDAASTGFFVKRRIQPE